MIVELLWDLLLPEVCERRNERNGRQVKLLPTVGKRGKVRADVEQYIGEITQERKGSGVEEKAAYVSGHSTPSGPWPNCHL